MHGWRRPTADQQNRDNEDAILRLRSGQALLFMPEQSRAQIVIELEATNQDASDNLQS